MKLITVFLVVGCASPGGIEQMHAIYSKDGQALKTELVATGNHDSVSVNALSLVVQCTLLKCDHITLAHNHPGKAYAHASQGDIDNADKFNEIMKQANITTDFVIIANNDCERIAYEAAGQAMSNVQYSLDMYYNYQALSNCTIGNGCLSMPVTSSTPSGATSGPTSQTGYRGPNSRQAYDDVIKSCTQF